MLEALAHIPPSLKLVATVQAANAQITAAFGLQASKAIGDYAQKQTQEAARFRQKCGMR